MVTKAGRLLAVLAGLSILLVSFQVAFGANTSGPFPDVDSEHPYVDAIQYLKDQNVIGGYPDGSFQPDRVLNRAEQLKVYMLLHGIDPDSETYKECFPDVGEQWFAKYICYAKSRGWVKGNPSGLFLPSDDVNKAEAYKMLGEIQEWNMEEPTEDVFSDVGSGAWYAKYVKYAHEANLIAEINAEAEASAAFGPSSGFSRALTAEFVYRSLAPFSLGEMYKEDLDEEIRNIDVEDFDNDDQVIVPVAEYGDAPESSNAGYAGSYSNVQGNFPTMHFTQNSPGYGAHALNSQYEWLGDPDMGDSYSYEADADDPSDPDGTENLVNEDKYDDGLLGINIPLISIPPPARVSLDTTIGANAPEGKRYINMLVDLNMDGEWGGMAAGGEYEWTVKNYEFTQTPGTTETRTLPEFPWSHGYLLTPTTWVRVVITREPIDENDFGHDGWDGSGEFEYGEVEDYYVQLPPTPGDDDPDDTVGGHANHGHGLIWGKPAPVMMCPKHRQYAPNITVIYYVCWVFNYGGNGNVKYDKWLIDGGVSVTPTTEVFHMPTAPPNPVAGNPFGVVGNPTPKWFKAVKGALPSTWGYRVVGVDPPSTVTNSVVDLGLEVEDKEITFDEAPFEYDDFWGEDGIGDYYIYGGESMSSYPPVILGMDVHEYSDDDYTYAFKIYTNVYDKDTSDSDMSYSWNADCGELTYDGGYATWKFNESSCYESAPTMTVGDGSDELEYSFAGFFEDYYVEEDGGADDETGEPPVYEGYVNTFVLGGADDEQVYHISVTASDPEGGDIFYNWNSISCGSFEGDLFSNKVAWHWSMNEDACLEMGATFTLQITDEEENIIEVEETIVFE